MEKLLDRITAAVSEAFVNCGYEAEYGKVTISNRPDLCEYQCNGAMAGAKKYHCAPIQIANKVAESLKEQELFSEVADVVAEDSGIGVHIRVLCKRVETALREQFQR